MFAYTANNDNFGRLRNLISDCKVAGSMPVLGINGNHLTSTLCSLED